MFARRVPEFHSLRANGHMDEIPVITTLINDEIELSDATQATIESVFVRLHVLEVVCIQLQIWSQQTIHELRLKNTNRRIRALHKQFCNVVDDVQCMCLPGKSDDMAPRKTEGPVPDRLPGMLAITSPSRGALTGCKRTSNSRRSASGTGSTRDEISQGGVGAEPR